MKRRFFLGVMAATPIAPVIAATPTAEREEEIEYLGEIQRITIKPGDTLVLTLERNISWETAQRLRNDLEPKFPGHQILVLSGGMKLGVMGS